LEVTGTEVCSPMTTTCMKLIHSSFREIWGLNGDSSLPLRVRVGISTRCAQDYSTGDNRRRLMRRLTAGQKRTQRTRMMRYLHSAMLHARLDSNGGEGYDTSCVLHGHISTGHTLCHYIIHMYPTRTRGSSGQRSGRRYQARA